jgi:two-component system OmpR family sensor kinase
MSLRGRLILAVGVVVLVALVVTDVAIYSSLSSSLTSSIDNTLSTLRRPIEQLVAHVPDDHGDLAPQAGVSGILRPPAALRPNAAPPPAGVRGEGDRAGLVVVEIAPRLCQTLGLSVAPGTFVELRNVTSEKPEGAICVAHVGNSKSYAPSLPAHITGFRPSTSGPAELATYFTTRSSTPGGPGFRVRVSLLNANNTTHQLVIALPMTGIDQTLARLLAIELIVSAAALLVGLALSLWLVRVGLRPLGEVAATADAIAEGALEHRAKGANARTEVGHLARAFNVMLERIEEAFRVRDATEDRLRRFVADASHELRTPIAAVSAYAELFEQGAASRRDDLERAMSGIRSETARMSGLVEDLLLLARLDEGRPLEAARLELVGIASEAIATANAVGPQWPVRLQASDPVEVIGDELRLRQVIDNLLANVRAHTPAGTTTVVSVSARDGEALLEVIDDGPGIEQADAARVFHRFYRADPSRSRQSGGSGLGLAIVASIVQAHRGVVELSPDSAKGAHFSIRLPLAPDQREP